MYYLLSKVNVFFYIFFILMSISKYAYSDIFINVSATMISPACDISSSDGSSPLKIDFEIVNVEKLKGNPPVKNFSIFISNCDLSKSLSLAILPKTNGIMNYNGINVLSTSSKGLGIMFLDITNGKDTILDVEKITGISPNILNGKGKLDLQSKLVSSDSSISLKKGAFNASMTILITYN